MIDKISKIIIVSVVTSTWLAAAPYRAVENKEQGNKMENGWRFDGTKESNSTLMGSKKSTQRLLEELLKVAKEQRDIQKEILKIMQDRFDPQPKEITLKDGTKCIANSSAKCFKMPLEPVSRQIPVLGKWIAEPTKENAKAWLQWQATYFSHVFRAANAMQFAVAQWGKEAYPISSNGSSYRLATGEGEVVYDRAKVEFVNALSDKFEVFLFFGDSPAMDTRSYITWGRLVKKLDKVKFTLVFKNESAKEVFDAMVKKGVAQVFYLNKASEKIVNAEYFKKYNIYTTPTLAVYTKPLNKMDVLSAGKGLSSSAIDLILDIMEFNNIIKPDYLDGSDAWNTQEVNSEFLGKDYFGDVNASYINSKYREGRSR